MNTTPTTDPIWDSTQMDGKTNEQKSDQAIAYMLQRIHDEPYIAWYCGIGTQAWSLLTESLASLRGLHITTLRDQYKPASSINPENPKVIRETARFASLEFFRRMDKELQIYACRKGSWLAWKPDRATCMAELNYHLAKLGRAIQLNDKERVAEFCADLANVAMKTAEIHGAEDEE
jgi:hypothetical protein